MKAVTGILLCAAAVPAGAWAQSAGTAPEGPRPRFEVTPFAGYRFGGDFELADTEGDVDLDEHGSFALALDLRRDHFSQYELFYSRQATSLEDDSPAGDLDVDVEYLHIGGTLTVTDAYPVEPYIVGTLGATRFSPSPPEGSSDTRFSFSLGGGLRIPFSERFSLRLEARGYLTFMDSDTAVFCASDEEGGVCAIRSGGSTFLQWDILAGAAIAF